MSFGLIPSTAVKVVPRSIKHDVLNCESKVPLEIKYDPLSVGEELVVHYTYSVTFMVSFHVMKQEIFIDFSFKEYHLHF